MSSSASTAIARLGGLCLRQGAAFSRLNRQGLRVLRALPTATATANYSRRVACEWVLRFALRPLPFLLCVAALAGLFAGLLIFGTLRPLGLSHGLGALALHLLIHEAGPTLAVLWLALCGGADIYQEAARARRAGEHESLRHFGLNPAALLHAPYAWACAFATLALSVVFSATAVLATALTAAFGYGVSVIELLDFWLAVMRTDPASSTTASVQDAAAGLSGASPLLAPLITTAQCLLTGVWLAVVATHFGTRVLELKGTRLEESPLLKSGLTFLIGLLLVKILCLLLRFT